MALADAWSRVTAAPVIARLTQPPADVSAMDGYALRAADGTLGADAARSSAPPRPAIRSRARSARARPCACSPAASSHRAPMPSCCRRTPPPPATEVRVNEAVTAGRHIRRAGQDFAAGDAVVPAGRRLTARDIGLAAAANHPWLTVHRRPRVAILATGDEIAMPGEPIPPGGIVSSNSHALAALVRAAGGEPVVLPVAADTREAIAAVADAVHGMDMLVTTGGASVGDHDLVIEGLQTRGLKLDFWQIAMRPGKPLLFGRLGAGAGARAAGQSGLGDGLRDPVPAAGAEPARPACRPRRRRPSRRSPAPRCAPTTTAPTICAPPSRTDARRPDRRDPVPGAGFGDAAPPRARRCADPAGAARAGAAGRQRGDGDPPRFAWPLTRIFTTIGFRKS